MITAVQFAQVQFYFHAVQSNDWPTERWLYSRLYTDGRWLALRGAIYPVKPVW